jgi:hypothetical protein
MKVGSGKPRTLWVLGHLLRKYGEQAQAIKQIFFIVLMHHAFSAFMYDSSAA